MFVAAVIFQGMRFGKNLNICQQFAKNVPKVTWFFRFGKLALSIRWSFHAKVWVKLQLNHLEIFTKLLSNIRFFQHPPPEISLINAQNDIWPCSKAVPIHFPQPSFWVKLEISSSPIRKLQRQTLHYEVRGSFYDVFCWGKENHQWLFKSGDYFVYLRKTREHKPINNLDAFFFGDFLWIVPW